MPTTPRKKTVSQLDAEMREGFAALKERLCTAARRHKHPALGHKIAGFQRELAALREQFDSSGPNLVLAGQLDELTATVQDHEDRISALEAALRELAAKQASDARRVDTRLMAVATSASSAHARIDVLERFSRIAFGIVGGILLAAWFFWYLPTSFGGSVLTTPGGTPTGEFVPSQLDTTWGAILGLVVVLLAAVAAGYLFSFGGRVSSASSSSSAASAAVVADTTANDDTVPVDVVTAQSAAAANAST